MSQKSTAVLCEVKGSKKNLEVSGFKIDSKEGPYNSGTEYANGNMGHRPPVKGGYFPVPPVDSEQDMRGEYLKSLKEVGIKVEKHHHEVAPSQHELGMYFGTLVDQADNVQLYKYVVQMVTHSFGKTATFMPKPIAGDNGSGMHIHQSIWKNNKPVFSFIIVSFDPPILLAIISFSIDCASTATLPNASGSIEAEMIISETL